MIEAEVLQGLDLVRILEVSQSGNVKQILARNVSVFSELFVDSFYQPYQTFTLQPTTVQAIVRRGFNTRPPHA